MSSELFHVFFAKTLRVAQRLQVDTGKLLTRKPRHVSQSQVIGAPVKIRGLDFLIYRGVHV